MHRLAPLKRGVVAVKVLVAMKDGGRGLGANSWLDDGAYRGGDGGCPPFVLHQVLPPLVGL